MHTFKQGISNLINKEIIVLVNRVHTKFPETSIDAMLDIWCLQGISFEEMEFLLELELEKTKSENTESENTKFKNTEFKIPPLIQSIIKVVNKKIIKFAKKMPHTSEYSVLTIWCEQQNMPLSVFGLNENKPCMQRDSKMKTCQHIYIKEKMPIHHVKQK